jgi:hypothetical protein
MQCGTIVSELANVSLERELPGSSIVLGLSPPVALECFVDISNMSALICDVSLFGWRQTLNSTGVSPVLFAVLVYACG